MTSDLSNDAIFILNILYTNRNIRSDRGYNSELLKKVCMHKISCDFEDVIKELEHGYITRIKKKVIKYYISDMKKAILVLDAHGYSVTKGKTRKL